MCWSGEASFTLAACGFTGAAIAVYRKEPVYRWLPLVYFSGMETLQGFTYSWIGMCGNNYNYWLTVLSYLHICFQPFFANMFNLSFLSTDQRKKAWWIWIVNSVASLIMLMMFLNPSFPEYCTSANQSLCGPITCSYHGNWHIAWMLELSNLDPHFISYWIAVFIFPLFFGGKKFVVYHLLLGPVLSALLTNDKNEQPAIWCLLSIGFLMATHIKPIKMMMLSKKAKEELKG